MNNQKLYDEYSKLELFELAAIMAGREEDGAKANIARLIHEERIMQRQHEYTIKQMEIQHEYNKEIMSKQVRWIKFSAVLTCVSTLAAAVAGVMLTYIMMR